MTKLRCKCPLSEQKLNGIYKKKKKKIKKKINEKKKKKKKSIINKIIH